MGVPSCPEFVQLMAAVMAGCKSVVTALSPCNTPAHRAGLQLTVTVPMAEGAIEAPAPVAW
ncbi:hypothetical protein GALL_503420 [mine drainage metagenome]|uniref:Uncharacterized protein n=1 Tax=mine drainage metagenome TaxID=410659 RepID=A0A1J5P9V5_9ZZZZ